MVGVTATDVPDIIQTGESHPSDTGNQCSVRESVLAGWVNNKRQTKFPGTVLSGQSPICPREQFASLARPPIADFFRKIRLTDEI